MAEKELKEKFLATYAENIEKGLYEEDDLDMVRNEHEALLQAYNTHLKGVVDDAVSHMDNAFRWRKTFRVKDLTEGSFPKSLIEQNVIFFSNVDKSGDCIMHVQCVKMKKDSAFTEIAKKLLVHRIEQHFQTNLGKRMVVLYDMSGTGINNVDTDFIRFLISCFTSYYPATLSYLLLVEMPWILNAVWQVVKKWLSEEQKKHVKMAKKADLLQYINEDELFTHLGGNCSTIKDPFRRGTSNDFITEEFETKVLTLPTMKSTNTSGSPVNAIRRISPTNSLNNSSFLYIKGVDEENEDERLSNFIVINPVDFLEFDPIKNISNSIYINNHSDLTLAFKVKCTKPELFKVNPHMGLIYPHNTLRINCTVIFGSKLMKFEEKIMISVMVQNNKETTPAVSLFKNKESSADFIIDCKLDEFTLKYIDERKFTYKENIMSQEFDSDQLNQLKHLIILLIILVSFPILNSLYKSVWN